MVHAHPATLPPRPPTATAESPCSDLRGTAHLNAAGRDDEAEQKREAMMTASTAACVLAVWVLVAAGLSYLGSHCAPLASSKPQREFDYFALSLQWPDTICASIRHCCPSDGCCRSEPLQTFTIHGLWPDYDDGTWPAGRRAAATPNSTWARAQDIATEGGA